MIHASNQSHSQFCLRRYLAGGLVLGLASFNPAFADVTGVFETGGVESLTIEYRDDDHVRMRTADGSYMLVTGGEGYMVSREGGDWVVYAMEDFRAMFAGIGSVISDEIDLSEMVVTTGSPYELRDTGRTETIAGIRGRVHEVVVSDGTNEEVSGELVLTDHRDAVKVYRGMLRMTRIMGEMAGQHGFDQFMAGMYGIEDRAILRADQGWQLASIERNAIPANAFTLPAEPTKIEGLSALFGGGNEGEIEEIGAAIGGWLSEIADEIGSAAGNDAPSATQEVDSPPQDGSGDDLRDRVRRGLRGLFDR